MRINRLLLVTTLLSISYLLIVTNCLAESSESITITTYYPSPYGSYREVSAHRMKIGSTYSDAATIVDDNDLLIEGNVGIGTTSLLPTSSPDGNTSGNLYANDVWLRGTNTWVSQTEGSYANFSNSCISYPGTYASTSGCPKQTGSVGNWYTIPNMSINRSFPAGRLLISTQLIISHWDCCSPCYSGNFRLLIDGNTVKTFSTRGCEPNTTYDFSFQYIAEIATAGQHSIELQWQTGENIATINSEFYTIGDRNLVVTVVQ